MNDKKRVLKQFEWFEVQTKVRQIIAEVIEPLQKKILANSLSLNKLHSHSENEQKKVEYLTLMVNNDPQIFNHGIFANIEDKINRAKMHSKQLQGKVLHLEEFIEKKVELLQVRLRESGEVLAGLRQFKQHVQDEISNQNNKLVQSQQNLFANFDQTNADITSVRMDIQTMKKQQATMAEKIVQLAQTLNHFDSQLEKGLAKFRVQIKETVIKQERQALIIQSLQEDIKRVGRFQKYTRQLQAKIQNLAIAVDNVEYKAEVIQPIVALTQINEYNHHILPPTLRDNISIYYYNRYKQMVEEIIAGEMDREEKKEKVGCSRKINLELVKEVHKRSTKCVFKLKKQKLAQKGIDIDSLPHDKKQELLNNLKIEEEFSDLVTNNTAPEKIDHREKQTPQEYAMLRDQLIQQLRGRIQQELKDSKQYILNMEEELKKEIENLELKLENLSRTVKNNEKNMQLEAKSTQQFQKNLENQSEKIQKEIQSILQLFRDISTVLEVHHLIEKQDQTDRLSIALLGGRQRHRDDLKQSQQSRKRNSVQLSEKCLSCSGNPNYYKQMFKLACLNYNSSPINLSNHSYERMQLLDKMQNELAKINNSLNVLTRTQETTHPKKDQTKNLEQKSSRFDSQIMALPINESRSNSHQQIVRNVASSQEMRYRYNKPGDSPRIINSSEMMESLMNKNLSRLFTHKRDTLREFKQRKESTSRESKQRSQFMVNVGSYFKELRKQNKQFMK